MAKLENCPTCGNATSENAKLCPSCGEPLEDGWAMRKTPSEPARKQKKTNSRKKYYFAVIAGVFIAILLTPSEDKKLEKLATENSSQYQALTEQRRIPNQEQITGLENEAIATPETDFNRKIILYTKLASFDSSNIKYIDKLAEYQKKNRIKAERQAQEIARREERLNAQQQNRKRMTLSYLNLDFEGQMAANVIVLDHDNRNCLKLEAYATDQGNLVLFCDDVAYFVNKKNGKVHGGKRLKETLRSIFGEVTSYKHFDNGERIEIVF